MSKPTTSFGVCLIAMVVQGCTTNFIGSAKFPGGARGCWERCQADGMEMATFVYVGEYSTACACRSKALQGQAQSDASNGEQAAVVAAAAGVALQRRRAEQQAQHTRAY